MLKIGDKILCKKGCSCGCGLSTGEKYRIKYFDANRNLFTLEGLRRENLYFGLGENNAYELELIKEGQLEFNF